MMNNCQCIGRMTKEIEMKISKTGKAYCFFHLAVKRHHAPKETPKTDFLPICFWGKQAEILAKYAGKGMLLSVCGRIETNTYTNREGKQVTKVEIVGEHFDFLEKKKQSEASETTMTEEEWNALLFADSELGF